MWVPLHLHSQYSILDACCCVEAIAKKAVEYQMPSVALTDHGNMHGAVEFFKACKSHKIKPIIGCEVYVAPDSRFEKKKGGLSNKGAYHLVLLAKNEEGYHNLCRLSSAGYLEGFYYHPRIDKELLSKHAKGLICLSACLSSQISHAALYGTEEQLYQEINWHHQLFGEDFYLELQRHVMPEEKLKDFNESWLVQHYQDFIAKQEKVNQKLIEASKRLGIKCVATNDTHYIEPDDWLAHEIVLNIQSGEPIEIWEKDSFGNDKFRIPNPKRRVYASHELYFKSPEEMKALFLDIPEAISTTLEVAEKCNVKLDFETKHYPIYIPPSLQNVTFTKEEQAEESGNYLKKLCQEGLEKRYTPSVLEKVAEKYPGKDPLEVVKERLALELEIILSKGMCDYLLIVWDFINWAKQNGIPVGPGRGSGAGSIILYLIGVTDIEPLRFDLFFERFINPERISYPDIDVDICMDRRQDVIDYTVKKYGKQNVAQIITFGTMKAKMSIKDVGRVLSVPLAKVNAIAKLVPEDLNMTLPKALEIDVDLHQLYTSDPEAKRVLDLAMKLEGSIRNTGIHAAGIIICGEPLTDHIPICLAKDSEMAATQYSMKPVEAVGMLKIDFLGLKTLTSIKIAVDAIKKGRNRDIDWVNLPLEDKVTFSLLHQGRTNGVFQMESGGMQELSKQLQPDKFEEIIAIGALYRPGPMDMIPSFINRKHKRESIEYDHPRLESILDETYGIMVYQEQVMQIATQLASYSLGEGDVLRRAMGKKDMAQMIKEREKFNQGAIKNGISEEVATAIFDKMEKFAAYGFNKSHAAAYGYLTYVTAYLKANYPKEWMAALMTCDRDDISKVSKLIRECQALDIAILPPDVNEAGTEFLATNEGIRFAMTGIKGIGEGVVDAILQERNRKGSFKSFYDFFKRMDLKKIGKKAIEGLVDAGCFDFTSWSRDALRESIEQMYETALKEQKEDALGIMTFFSLMKEKEETAFKEAPQVVSPRTKDEIFKREKELLGFFLTGHPMDNYRQLFGRLSSVSFEQIEKLDHQAVFRTVFIIESVSVKIASKTQRKFAVLMIGDGLQSFELPIWSDLYEEKNFLLVENQLIYAVLQVDKREESLKLNCKWLDDLTKVNEAMIEACDKAYDRAKMQPSRTFSSSFSKSKEQIPATQSMPMKTVTIKANAHLMRLSGVLKLKELLANYRGNHPLMIEFYSPTQKRLGVLHLDGKNSVNPDSSFTQALLAVPGVAEVKI